MWKPQQPSCYVMQKHVTNTQWKEYTREKATHLIIVLKLCIRRLQPVAEGNCRIVPSKPNKETSIRQQWVVGTPVHMHTQSNRTYQHEMNKKANIWTCEEALKTITMIDNSCRNPNGGWVETTTAQLRCNSEPHDKHVNESNTHQRNFDK